MTVDTIFAGTPAAAQIDWAVAKGADCVVPILWTRNGAPVNLVGAVVQVRFSAAPTGGVVPAAINSGVTNADGSTISLADGTTPANMTVTIPAAATLTYAFRTIRYTMTVTYPGSGTLRWAEGSVTFDDGA